MIYFLLCIFVLSHGCAVYKKAQKADIKNSLLESLSRDLAEIDIIVENARNEFKEELMMVKVLEPWSESPGLKIGKVTASTKEVFDVMAKSKIEVPTLKGLAIADVLKMKAGKTKFIGVFKPEMFDTVMASAFKESITEGYAIKFFDPQIAWDPKASKAIMQYVSLTARLEKKAREILDKLVQIKKKYMNSPIYIEGFTISLPLLSVDIQFKFR